MTEPTPLAASDPGLLILTSLAAGPKHGYAITRDIAEQVGVSLGPGTLYGAISRLEARGFIRALPSDDRRRPYELTATGSQALARRATELRTVADLGLSRLRLAGGVA
jgi:DNA-binding PadR family transcriptional regulator